MDKSVFNLKTQLLTSNVRSTVKRADFEVAGDTMKFEMVTRLGTLEGNVKMVVRGKARTPEDEPK
jgi:lipopolysaccharide export system protein LptC